MDQNEGNLMPSFNQEVSYMPISLYFFFSQTLEVLQNINVVLHLVRIQHIDD